MQIQGLRAAPWGLLLFGLSGVHGSSAAADGSPGVDALSDSGVVAPAIHVTRLDYSAFDVPEAVTVITREDIREAGYLKISEIFRGVAGFRVVDVGSESRVSYHGTAAQQVRRMLVSINGRSVLVGDGQYAEFNRLPIALEDVERVTVTRGPNGAAYGDNAFLVSIDFRTAGRDDPQGVTVRAGGGNEGRERASAAVNEQVGPYQLAFSGGHERDGNFDYYDSAHSLPRNDVLEITRGLFSLETEFDQRSRWHLDANFYNSENPTGIEALSFLGTDRNQGQFAVVSNQREIGQSSRLDWYLSYNRQREEIRNSGCYTPEAIAHTSATVTNPAQLAGLLAPTLFVPELLATSLANTCFFTDLDVDASRKETGLEYESQHGRWRYLIGTSASQTDAQSAQYFAGRHEIQRSYRAFGETDFTAGQIHGSLGVMVQDASNVQSTEPAWRGALTWQFLPDQAIRYAYAHSFRIPSLLETEIHWAGAYNFGRRDQPQALYPITLPLPLITDSMRLKPETIDSQSIGYFGSFFHSSATLDLKVFSDSIHDPIESTIFDFSPPPSNSTPFTIKGAELNGTYRVSDHWKVNAQYSYLVNTSHDPLELELQSRNAGSLLIVYRPVINHSFTLGYYANSDMSGHSYARCDFVYNFSRTLWSNLFQSKLIVQHHITPGEGLRDPNPLLSNEGYFAHVDQLFLSLELTL
jgi:iron complex outermembrane receptor protein